MNTFLWLGHSIDVCLTVKKYLQTVKWLFTFTNNDFYVYLAYCTIVQQKVLLLANRNLVAISQSLVTIVLTLHFNEINF
jgi:hypothetical protein